MGISVARQHYRHIPPRTYLSPVSDDSIIAVFDLTAQLKAATVLRLLGLRCSRQRIIDARLRRLSHPPQQRLVESSPSAIAVHRNPFYSRPYALYPHCPYYH